MCLCETAGQIIALAVTCIVVEGLYLIGNIRLMDQHGITVTYVLFSLFAAGSLLFAIFLLVGASTGKKSYIENFLLGAKIRVLLQVLLVLVSAAMYYMQAKKYEERALVEPDSAMNFTTFLETLVPGKWAREHLETLDVTALESIKVSIAIVPVISIVIDCFVIWRIQLFANTMPG